MAMVFVGLGSNMGDRVDNIRQARREMAQLSETILLEDAPLYETTPVGGPAGQDDYVNSVSLIETKQEPRQLLRCLQDIERGLGRLREKETGRWGPRFIDLDILLWGDAVVEETDLVIPHPRMAQRAFVLTPLADIDADLLHPVLELTVRELLERNGHDNEGVRRLSV